MIAGLVDLWNRVLGRRSEPRLSGDDERRVWVRHPSDAETIVQSLYNGLDTRLSAAVRNVSRGGINLRIRHSFKPGDIISVDLPDATREMKTTVLACVVHVSPLTEGEWAIGCAFADELSEAELGTFGGRRERSDLPDDRGWVRFDCNVTATYQEVEDNEQEEQPARVVNVSANGVGLVVDRPLSPGGLITLRLESATRHTSRTILACAVHVTARANREWLVGCNFIRELTEEDLRALL